MKGVVLSIPVRGKSKRAKPEYSLRDFFRKNLITLVLTLCFTFGLVWGGAEAAKAEEDFLNNMDFLFTTNLEARLSLSAVSSFGAHFASDFIFFFAAVLCALSPWGVGVLPLLVAFKGFGTGLSGAYLISNYGLKGFGFYIVVVLPGAFLFSLAYTFMCSASCRMSAKVARAMFSSLEGSASLWQNVKKYLLMCVRYLLISAGAALCDMFFWNFVSKLFFK